MENSTAHPFFVSQLREASKDYEVFCNFAENPLGGSSAAMRLGKQHEQSREKIMHPNKNFSALRLVGIYLCRIFAVSKIGNNDNKGNTSNKSNNENNDNMESNVSIISKAAQSTRAMVRVQGKDVQVRNVTSCKTWRDLVAAFITSQDVRESSRKLYTRTLSQFFVWAEQRHKVLSLLERGDVLEYKDHLQMQSLSSLTISSYITAVRKFYEWAEAEKAYPNIARGIKTPRRKQAFKKQHLTDNKSGELLAHFENLSLRDYAIVNLILRTGLRTIEVVRANIEDITFKGERRVLKVWGKGHSEKDDFVVLSDKAFIPIKNYLAAARKGAKAGEPLFTSTSHNNFGGRLTTKTISAMCKDGLKAIGLDGKEYTAHSLRHTTAVAILKHGGQITDVQSVLRHTSPVTSQIYTESVKEEMRLEQAPELKLDAAF